MPVDAQTQTLLEFLAQAGLTDLVADRTPQQVRELMASMRFPSDVEVAAVEDRALPPAPGSDTPIPVRIYRPRLEGPPAPVLVWFHGGGWVIGDLDGADGTCRALCRDGDALVVSVDYRLAPEHPFPAAVEDCWAATRWVADQGGELGGDPARLAVGGDSAGGNLAAVVAQLARDAGGPPICFQALVYPVTDATCDRPSIRENAEGYLLTTDGMEWFYGHYLGAHDRRDPRVSPLLAPDLTGLPPAYVVTAEYDPLRDQGRAYVEALTAAGVPATLDEVAGTIHGFFSLDQMLDVATQARARLVAAWRDACGAGG
jgi:acetyl esterase